MARPPMLHSLLAWGDIVRRWQGIGLGIGTATTMVESGFYAHRVLMFEKQQKSVLYKHFCLHAQLTAMFLNYSLLRRLQLPDKRQEDPRFVALLETAHDRMKIQCGLGATSEKEAEGRFREVLKL